jgi:hypothetical protein
MIVRQCAGDRRWSFDCVTACQGCVSANLCPRCAALVQPSAKIRLLDLRGDPLAPKADTLAPRFPVCWVQPLRFSEFEHGPTLLGVLGAYRRGPCQTSLETGLADSSPHEAVSSSLRLPPQDKGQAGVTPHGLCRDCPAPREDSVSGNRTANRQKRFSRRLLAENGFRGVDDAHGRILPAIGGRTIQYSRDSRD